MNFNRFPRRNYLQGQTPIEPMPSLAKALGKKNELYVKRDDLLPGAAGGNKTRKLEFCLGDALEKGADTIITCGAVQSNHCRLTLSWAVKEQMDCHLILEERVKGSYKPAAGFIDLIRKDYFPEGSKIIFLHTGGSPVLYE